MEIAFLLVGLVFAVASPVVKLTRIRPPRRYLAIIWAGVSTPPSFWLPWAAPADTVFASRP